MPYIQNEDEIKRRADIVQIIGRRVPLKPGRSSDHLEGSCPFHASKSGKSFHVRPDRQDWWCWGCQKGGSIASFIMEFESCSYHEALEIMAQESGVIIEYDNSHRPPERKEGAPKRQDVSAAMDAACLHYQKCLLENSQALDYLAKRGCGRSVVERWRLGYAKGDSVKGVAIPELLVACGVLKLSQTAKEERLYDPLAGRITIPITDHLGRVVAFTGRLMEAVEGRPKYLNTSDTELFKKGKTLFGFAQSRPLVKANPRMAVHIVEGQLKALACIENGLPAVAAGGTAFTPEHAALIHSLTTLAVWCPDPDEAGEKAVLKGAPIARDAGLDLWIGILEIPDSITEPVKDPDDLMAMGLPVRYEYRTLVDWLYGRVADGHVRTAQEARRVAEEIVPVIERHPLMAVRMVELQRLSELSGIPESQLKTAKESSVVPVTAAVRQEETKPVIDTAMPPERLLFSAVLWQGWGCDWQKLIPWCDLTTGQWGVLANIAHCLGYAGKNGLSLADGIMAAGKDRLRDYLMYWAQVPEGRTADIASLAAQVGRANREQAAAQQAATGNFGYASYLKEG